MGLRGPAPKPTIIEIAEGRPGHRRLNSREPKPQIGEPAMPRHLDREGKKHWRELVDIFLPTRVLTVQDGVVLGQLAARMAEYDSIEKEIRANVKEGKSRWLVKEAERARINPLSRKREELGQLIVQLIKEFGGTPAARSRVQIAPEAEQISAAEEMCG